MRHCRILVLHKNGYPYRVGRPLGDIGEATREWKEVHRDKIVVVLSCDNDPGETWLDDDTGHHPAPRTRIGVAPTLGTAWRVVLFEKRAEGIRIAYTLQWGLPDQTEARKRARAWRKRWPRPTELLRRLEGHAKAAARYLAPEGGAS